METEIDHLPDADLAIRPLTGQDAAAFKALRLLAIRDAPMAVWPTADEEGEPPFRKSGVARRLFARVAAHAQELGVP